MTVPYQIAATPIYDFMTTKSRSKLVAAHKTGNHKPLLVLLMEISSSMYTAISMALKFLPLLQLFLQASKALMSVVFLTPL